MSVYFSWFLRIVDSYTNFILDTQVFFTLFAYRFCSYLWYKYTVFVLFLLCSRSTLSILKYTHNFFLQSSDTYFLYEKRRRENEVIRFSILFWSCTKRVKRERERERSRKRSSIMVYVHIERGNNTFIVNSIHYIWYTVFLSSFARFRSFSFFVSIVFWDTIQLRT